MNILTFDVEEWFHLLDFDATRTEAEWEHYEVRIYENVERIFKILEETDSKATFFIIGWIAKKYPDLVRNIADKYQIGSHTMNHQLVWQQNREDFKEDVTSSIKQLEDITGHKVECFRAPGFSVRESEGWAFEILYEAGIRYDSSVFPARHAHGGMPGYGAPVPSIVKYNDVEIREFPVSSARLMHKDLIFAGGGYFRLFPYSMIKYLADKSPNYLLSYIHPRDLDVGQPVLKGLPLKRRFKSYVGLKGAEQKLRKFLSEYRFIDLRTASEAINWDSVPTVNI